MLGRIVTAAGLNPALDPGISAYLEAVRDYLVVADTSGRILALSEAARSLPAADLERLRTPLDSLGALRPSGTIDLAPTGRSGQRTSRFESEMPAPSSGGVLVATSTTQVAFGPAQLLRSMLFISPLILVGSALIGYWLAGTSLRPVQGIMDEVEAITDGRSLHRRLAVPVSGDEMARLAITVNGMLARLERSFDGLHRFTADASHELKTPLQVLRVGVERALVHPGVPHGDARVARRDAGANQPDDRTGGEPADAGARRRRQEFRSRWTRLDLRELVGDVAETAGMLGESTGVRVTSEMPPSPVYLAVDLHRIRKLLLNLVTNAVKYTPAGGTVAIALAEEDDAVVFTVRDTGIGIAPGDLPHIFDRFWRADPARSRTGERPGTGLGLAITKWIAEAHGGSITVQSRPGRGTSFVVRLPRRSGVSLDVSQDRR